MEFSIKSYGRNTIPTHFCNFLNPKNNKIPRQQEEVRNSVEFGTRVAKFKHNEVGNPPADFTVYKI